SDFQTPALVDRDEVVVAIATGGAAPVLSVDLRAAIERLLPPRIGRLAALAREMRSTVKRVLGDFEARRAFWERVLRGPARDLALAGDQEGARRAFLDTLNRPEAPREGVVHLVGAGPGDPELLTLRAARLLREADVIVHDRLVSPEVLDLARRDARRIDVGKQRNHHPVPQEAIEALLVEEAQKGQRVVRLKGGDPFIFGRGGEEITALRAAGLRVEVTPGISAALAAAASSQIPLTHRGLASSLTLASGVSRRGGPAPDLRALVEGTGALYMSVDAAPRIQAQLLALGRTGATPVALVEHASRDQERTVYCTLATLASTVVSEAVTGPAIIFLGDAVTLGAAYERAPERAPEPAPQQEAQRA
ncbi:MAG: siroheme synthase CysG, partial [Pseudomonadales bacterium]